MDVGNVLVHILVVLVAAKVGAEAAHRLGQPEVLGELLIGLAIGPSALGLVSSDEVLRVLGELGVILLLLQVGLETELTELMRVGRASLLVACIGVVLPFATAYGVLRATGLAGHQAHVELFVGAALTATSVGITARVFGDLRALTTPEARTVLGAAVADDVIGLVILTVVVRLVSGASVGVAAVAVSAGSAVAFLVVSGVVGLRLAPPLFHVIEGRARSEGTLIALALAFTLGLAQLASLVKLAPIVGAFAAGIVLARTRTRAPISRSLAPVGHVFIPVFFLQIGIDADLGAFTRPRALALAGVLILIGVVMKVASAVGAMGTSMDRLLIGLGMIPRGEVGLIFASIGLRQGIINQETYGALLAMVLVTTLVTPPVLAWRVRSRKAATVAVRGGGGARPSEPMGGDWLVVRGGEVRLAGRPPATLRPLLGLRAARLAATARPSAELVAFLEENIGETSVVWTPELRDELYRLLREGGLRSWRFLELTGLFPRCFPDLASLREGASGADTWELDPARVEGWATIDALAPLTQTEADPEAQRAWKALAHPERVLLAGLVADALDPSTPDRPRAAVAVSRRLSQRLGIGAGAEEDVAFLIREHNLLDDAAHRLDLLDEEAVTALAAQIGTADRARMLYLLTIAASGPEAGLGAWRRSLLDDLVRGVEQVLADPEITGLRASNLLEARRQALRRDPPALTRHTLDEWLERMPRRYLLAHPPETVLVHLGLADANGHPSVRLLPEAAGWRLDLVAPARPGLLADVTGVLTAFGFDIVQAEVATWSGDLAVDVFTLTGPASAVDEQRVERDLAAAAASRLDVHGLLRDLKASVSSAAPGPVDVHVDPQASSWHTVVEVRADDRHGLLHDILDTLASLEIDVHLARVRTEGGRARDVFHVTTTSGYPLPPRLLRAVSSELQRKLSR